MERSSSAAGTADPNAGRRKWNGGIKVATSSSSTAGLVSDFRQRFSSAIGTIRSPDDIAASLRTPSCPTASSPETSAARRTLSSPCSRLRSFSVRLRLGLRTGATAHPEQTVPAHREGTAPAAATLMPRRISGRIIPMWPAPTDPLPRVTPRIAPLKHLSRLARIAPLTAFHGVPKISIPTAPPSARSLLSDR